MNPKEKAKELYDAYEKIFIDANADSWGKEAIACAIIHVNGIIEVVISAWDKLGCGEIGELKDYIPYIFWQDVLIEIEKL